uniref:Integrase catalytic domain-containing protein n=1 Tax=Ciona intestinalis TaxID=7719 RepID=H2Y2I0_CIOIN
MTSTPSETSQNNEQCDTLASPSSNNDQQADEYLLAVKQYVHFGTYTSTCKNVNEKRKIRKAACNYVIRDNQMFLRKAEHLAQVLYTKEEHKMALKQCHIDEATGEHRGRVATQKKLSRLYYWKTITADIKKWIIECPECQFRNKVLRHKIMPPEKKIITFNEPWEVVKVDFAGPFPQSKFGNTYIFVATCLFSKFIYAKAIKAKTAQIIADTMLEMIFLYGPPHQVITGKGQEFVSTKEHVFKKFAILHDFASCCHIKSNGQDKSGQMFRKLINEHTESSQNDWDDHVRNIAYNINVTHQKSINCSPYLIMFKRQPKTVTLAEHKQTSTNMLQHSGQIDQAAELHDAVMQIICT